MAFSSNSNTKHKILLVEDHPIVSQGLALMINQQNDMAVCATADDHNKALQEIERLRPDLAIIDVSLKAGNGIDLAKIIKAHYPKTNALILSMHDENLYAIRALRAGAGGYIMKQEPGEKVLNAIRTVLGGETYVSDTIAKKLKQQLFTGRAPRTGSPLEDLSDRELEVFGLLGQGFGTRQIAEKLHLSVKTIESHRAHIKEKLNLKNAMELVQQAIQWRNV